MKHKFPSTLAAAAVALASQSAAAAPVLTYDGSKLIGATDVDVNGLLYDVTFSGGSCQSLFGGCADGSSFVISEADADAAGVAIADLVASAYLGGHPRPLNFIAGCSNALTRCDILTPYGVVSGTTVDTEDAVIAIQPATGIVLSLLTETVASGDTTDATTAFAVFTAEAAPGSVPEPGSTALVAIGLAGAAASLGRRRAG